ncbi:hypothetical protein CIC12_30320 [Burkholderia sp. SG-MS1]|nr:hypothetical protein [Paraburkholderia sp. SG-MS1]
MHTRADGDLAVWAAPMGRQIQSFLLDGPHVRSRAMDLRERRQMVPQATTEGHEAHTCPV